MYTVFKERLLAVYLTKKIPDTYNVKILAKLMKYE